MFMNGMYLSRRDIIYYTYLSLTVIYYIIYRVMGKACCYVSINIYDEFDILEQTVLLKCITTINGMAMLISE